MNDVALTALINSLPGLIVALATLVGAIAGPVVALMTLRQGRRNSKQTKVFGDKLVAKTEAIHRDTDGNLTEMRATAAAQQEKIQGLERLVATLTEQRKVRSTDGGGTP